MKRPFLSSVFRAIITLLLINFCISSQWVPQVSGTNYPLRSVFFINAQTGFIASNSLDFPFFRGGEIIRTTNGGQNWNRVLLDSNLRPKNIHFTDNNTGYVVGGSYSSMGYFFKTTNTGQNWSQLGDSVNTHLFNIQFVSPSTAFAGGTSGVLKTTDTGNTWERVLSYSGSIGYHCQVYFINQNTGFLAGDTADIYKTTNSGMNWSLYDLPYIQFYDIKFINDNTGYICGDSGTYYKTTNQGALWSKVNIGITQNLFSMFFPNPTIGYMTGERNIYKSTNRGDTWFTAFDFQSDTLFSSYFVDVNTGYTCGDNGRVYKTTTGGVIGINPISTEIPNDFSLSQNYPNPFNPTTNIKFALPKASFVRLAVYDMLGREVEALVNEHLTAGTYMVDWNAAKFSSGIYLYKLTANDFNMVKKMSLIK
jgi:photosystem II stability/assembly factor-like uncharacterized protein